MRKQKISLLINTKNEEKHIVDCIESAKSFVDEIIVVDMHSIDQTKELAKKTGAKVYLTKDVGYVEPARNFAIQKATHPWVLLLDADERAQETLLTKLQKIIQDDVYSAVWLPRKNIRFGKWMKHGGFWPDYQMRFFKKESVDWPKQIHRHPLISGEQFYLPTDEKLAILHYGINSVEQIIDKINVFTQHESYFSNLDTVSAEQLYHALHYEFAQRFFTDEGHKDGIEGFISAKAMEFYRFVEFLRYWEAKGYPEDISSKQLKELYNHTEQIEQLKRELSEIKDSKVFPVFLL